MYREDSTEKELITTSLFIGLPVISIPSILRDIEGAMDGRNPTSSLREQFCRKTPRKNPNLEKQVQIFHARSTKREKKHLFVSSHMSQIEAFERALDARNPIICFRDKQLQRKMQYFLCNFTEVKKFRMEGMKWP